MACGPAFSQSRRSAQSGMKTKRSARNCCRQIPSRLWEGREQSVERIRRIAPPVLFSAVRMVALLSFSWLHAFSAVAGDRLQFSESNLSDVREGYFSLRWNTLPDAAEYRMTTADGRSVYRGRLPQAFVSGLADGTYEYQVDALDADGQVIATSATLAVVEVEHWSLGLALSLLACGFAVFVIVVALIVKGTLQTRSPPTSSLAERGEHS